MPKIITLPTYIDSRGTLTVIEKSLPFEIKRVYFIENISKPRGQHKHIKTSQALICLNGSCKIEVSNNQNDQVFELDDSSKCLILDPEDWHELSNFSKGSLLLVLASHYYDKKDYLTEK